MRYLFFISLLSLLVFGCKSSSENIAFLEPADKAIAPLVDSIPYEVGNWEPAPYGQALTSHGYHRIVLEAPQGEAVYVRVPWRRCDPDPESKDVIIVDARSGEPVINRLVLTVNPEVGEFIFQPNPDSDTYYLYYLPYQTTGGYYPVVTYQPPSDQSEPAWKEKYAGLSPEEQQQLPAARLVSRQAQSEFHSFFPMEVPATTAEVATLLGDPPRDYYLFPEYREHPIRMRHFLSKHWVDRGLRDGLRDTVRRGEFWTFQVAVFAAGKPVSDLKVECRDLEGSRGQTLSADRFQSFNTGGINYDLQPFTKAVPIPQGDVQPLWIGLDVPADAMPGDYRGMVILQPEGMTADTIHLALTLSSEVVENHGDDQPELMTRLRWLNSTIGVDPDFIIDPFIPVETEGRTLRILGRSVELGDDGLPRQINSFFAPEMTRLQETAQPVLSGPVRLLIPGRTQDGWQSATYEVDQPSRGQAVWTVQNQSGPLNLAVKGALEYDGMLNYELALTAQEDVSLDDIILEIPMEGAASEYILGLGYKGGRRPASVNWQWDVTNHHEGVWLGGINRGLQYVLRDRNYERPLNTNFYQAKPLNLPPSWHNDGKGGIRIITTGEGVLCQNYSGPRQLAAGDTLYFQIRFLITPFKPINWKQHFQTRFVHQYVPVDTAIAWGGTVVNVHHAKEINPYINYPFYALEEQKAYIDEAHQKGVKVKLYNTIRELTYKAHELFALRSLGTEIFNDGEGGGHPWLQEHLREHYHKAWHAWRVDDAAILNKGTSRWTNYYIEGLNWLAKNQEIDGLYLDDIAFSRETVKRIAAVLNEHRPEVIIDLHSANQYNERDGFINSAFLYMEHFPYISRLWFGEYFEYDLGPDYWFAEVSGIPFGLTGEMLEGGGRPYHGLLYGMTTRFWNDFDPRPVWKLFQEVGIADFDLLGYWLPGCPVQTDKEKVLASVYRKNGEVLVALASWSDRTETVRLDIDWTALGLSQPERLQWSAPAIEGLQSYGQLTPGQPLQVPAQEGLVIRIQQSEQID